MAFTNKPDKSLPELTSQRRLRESIEGGPGSGPQGGGKSSKEKLPASHEGLRKLGFRFKNSAKKADGSYVYYYKHSNGRKVKLIQTGDADTGLKYKIVE